MTAQSARKASARKMSARLGGKAASVALLMDGIGGAARAAAARLAETPAKAKDVQLQEDGQTALVVVPDHQLSLAIGKEGQNARLAARLTGLRVDIKSEAQMREATAAAAPPADEPAADEPAAEEV